MEQSGESLTRNYLEKRNSKSIRTGDENSKYDAASAFRHKTDVLTRGQIDVNPVKTFDLSKPRKVYSSTADNEEYLLKRPLDIGISFIGILFSFPLWTIIAIAIWLEDRGPIFYFQERLGRDGRNFNLIKFRSMVVDAESDTGAIWAKEHDHRVTRVGRLLRASAMDELPQLVNIAKGDISLVGPRPERPELSKQFNMYIANFNHRVKVKPGLTGLAQVFGKYDSSPKHKLKYDLLYIKKQSLFLDLKLILLSFWITFRGKWESREKKF
jgi:lipopolysaccharide/colanic/teichoic acid biosynthesis glycosyltransferase